MDKKCTDCEIVLSSIYAHTPDNKRVCRECAGARIRAEMVKSGRITLYLIFRPQEVPDYQKGVHYRNRGWYVTDWAGSPSMVFPATIHKGRHNIARTRYDAWFRGPDGYIWHGLQYGENTQICHCRRTNRK